MTFHKSHAYNNSVNSKIVAAMYTLAVDARRYVNRVISTPESEGISMKSTLQFLNIGSSRFGNYQKAMLAYNEPYKRDVKNIYAYWLYVITNND